MREIYGFLRLASWLANSFDLPSQVRTQVLVLQTCADLRWTWHDNILPSGKFWLAVIWHVQPLIRGASVPSPLSPSPSPFVQLLSERMPCRLHFLTQISITHNAISCTSLLDSASLLVRRKKPRHFWIHGRKLWRNKKGLFDIHKFKWIGKCYALLFSFCTVQNRHNFHHIRIQLSVIFKSSGNKIVRISKYWQIKKCCWTLDRVLVLSTQTTLTASLFGGFPVSALNIIIDVTSQFTRLTQWSLKRGKLVDVNFDPLFLSIHFHFWRNCFYQWLNSTFQPKYHNVVE